LGAEVTLHGADSDELVRSIIDVTDGGAHVSMDALGSWITCRNSISCLRRRGRHVQVGLMSGDQANPPLPVGRIIAYELEFKGSHGMQAHRYDAMLGMILAGRVSPDDLISDRISLSEAPAALMQLPEVTQRGITVITDFG